MTVSCTYFGCIILIDSIVVQGNYREGIFVIEKTPVIGNLCVQYVVQYVDLPDPAGRGKVAIWKYTGAVLPSGPVLGRDWFTGVWTIWVSSEPNQPRGRKIHHSSPPQPSLLTQVGREKQKHL